MEQYSDKIELRSEKVKNIIGQIPSRIIRIGITVIFITISILIVGSYFFEYPQTIKTRAIFNVKSDSISAHVEIPANMLNVVKVGNSVFINFNDIPNINNEQITTQIQAIGDSIIVSNKGGFYLAQLNLPYPLMSSNGHKIHIRENITSNAEIIIGKTTVFNQVFQSVIGILGSSAKK